MQCFWRYVFVFVDSQYPENRIRNWNAYMLFYEAIDKNIVSNLPRTSSRELLKEEIQELRRYFFMLFIFIEEVTSFF